MLLAQLRTRRIWPWLTLSLIIIMLLMNVNILRTSKSKRGLGGDLFGVMCDRSQAVSIGTLPGVKIVSPKSLDQVLIRTDLISTIGHMRTNRGFLTIGIPSIKRINDAVYLMQTLGSIVEQTSAEERETVVVIVFLGDFDTSYNSRTTEAIMSQFKEHIESGFIQILTVSHDYYPPLDKLKRNFNDEPARVSWRAKQVLDFALMFAYARNISDYYIQIEDDVRCAKNYVSAIRDYVALRSHEKLKGGRAIWAMLEFSELGFIGKLFRSSDLDKLARYMTMFFEEQPVDWLMSFFKLSMGQRENYLRKPTIFQHIGLKSSFDITHDNTLKDRFFDSGSKPLTGDNPPATVMSPMPYHNGDEPEMAYSSGTGFFWATRVTAGDAIFVLFDDPIVVRRLVVQTGSEKGPGDVLSAGTVLLSATVADIDARNHTANCIDPITVGTFTNGTVDADNLDTIVSMPTKCVIVRADETQSHWVLFAQIAVYIKK